MNKSTKWFIKELQSNIAKVEDLEVKFNKQITILKKLIKELEKIRLKLKLNIHNLTTDL